MKQTFTVFGGRAIITGLAVSLLAGLVIISLITSLLLSGTLPEGAMPVGVSISLVITAFLGALIAGRGGDTKIAVRIAMSGGLYWLILFAFGALVLDGSITNLLRNLFCILIGCVGACAICIRNRKSKPRRKRAIR